MQLRNGENYEKEAGIGLLKVIKNFFSCNYVKLAGFIIIIRIITVIVTRLVQGWKNCFVSAKNSYNFELAAGFKSKCHLDCLHR